MHQYYSRFQIKSLPSSLLKPRVFSLSTFAFRYGSALQAHNFHGASSFLSNDPPSDPLKEWLAGQLEETRNFSRDLATRIAEITAKVDKLDHDLATRAEEITTKATTLGRDIGTRTGEITTKVDKLDHDLATRTGEITAKVNCLDRDLNVKMAGFGADLNQLEHHLMVQFSKLGEDIKVSVEKLKTIQTDLRSGQKELSRDLKASQQVLSTDVEWSRKELSTDLSSSRREITQDLDTRVTRLKNEVFGRENTFLTRALLTISGLAGISYLAYSAKEFKAENQHI